jgi:hypothetical protein
MTAVVLAFARPGVCGEGLALITTAARRGVASRSGYLAILNDVRAANAARLPDRIVVAIVDAALAARRRA